MYLEIWGLLIHTKIDLKLNILLPFRNERNGLTQSFTNFGQILGTSPRKSSLRELSLNLTQNLNLWGSVVSSLKKLIWEAYPQESQESKFTTKMFPVQKLFWIWTWFWLQIVTLISAWKMWQFCKFQISAWEVF